MLYTFDKKQWKYTYKDDFLDKIHSLESALESKDLHNSEYWFVITLTHSIYLIKQYLNLKNETYCKPVNLIEHASEKKIISDAEDWLFAINLSGKIGRAVRPKEENIPFITDFVRNFYDLIDTFDSIFKKYSENWKELE